MATQEIYQQLLLAHRIRGTRTMGIHRRWLQFKKLLV